MIHTKNKSAKRKILATIVPPQKKLAQNSYFKNAEQSEAEKYHILRSPKYKLTLSDMRKRASTQAVLAEIFSNCGNIVPTLLVYSKAKLRKFILNKQI